MRLTKYEKKHPAYRKKLERCIRMVKKSGASVSPWAVCRASLKR